MQGVITTIIFDLGGVLLEIDTVKTNSAFKKMGFNDIDDYFGIGKAAYFFAEYEKGSISDEEFVEKIKKKLDNKHSSQEIIDAWNAMLIKFPPERIEKLKELRKGYKIFLFSNTNAIHLKAFRKIFENSFQGATLESLFDKVYYSHELGARKPDVQSYIKIIQQNNLVPEETLFVDDAENNLEGAEKAGLQTFLIADGKTVMDLKL